MLKLAFCGLGSIACNRHLPEAVAEPNIHIQGYYTNHPESRNNVIEKYGGIFYSSYEEMLNDKEVTSVVISTPNCFHFEQSILAMETGKDVLCEKPMAITIEQAEKMIETANNTGRVLMIAHNLRLEPAFVSAKKHLASGALGRILSFTSVIGNEGPESGSSPATKDPWFFRQSMAGHGVSVDLAIHAADALLWLLEEPLIPVSAISSSSNKHLSTGAPIEVEDTVYGIFRTPSGTIGSISSSWCYYDGWQCPMVFYCENGVLRIYGAPNESIRVTMKDGTSFSEPSVAKEEWKYGSGIMHTFAEACYSRTPPEVTARPALEALRVVLACVSSNNIL